MLSKLKYFINLLVKIAKLPVAHLHFDLSANPDDVRFEYEYFTRPHAKYKIFKNKSLGVALIDLRAFDTRVDYIDTCRCGARHAKKAKS